MGKTEFFEGKTLEEFKTAITDTLASIGRRSSHDGAVRSSCDGKSEAKSIYLVYASQDAESIRPLRDYLDRRGYLLIETEGSPADYSKNIDRHWQNMMQSTGVMVFGGAANRNWLQAKILEQLNFQALLDDDRQPPEWVLYLADPRRADKDDLDDIRGMPVIRGYGDFQPSDLQDFLARVDNGASSSELPMSSVPHEPPDETTQHT